MIPFRCEQCGKNLQAKDELAGKKVKCPGCGSAVPVPRVTATGSASGKAGPTSPADDRTLPPRASAETGSQAEQASISDAERLTDAGLGPRAEPTASLSPGGSDPEVYDFLAPPQAPDELGRLGPYRVLKVLGAGGMGVVFRAEDPLLKRLVALKAMLPGQAGGTAKQRFLREAQAAAALKHDHIVSIYQVGEDRGAPFLAMEFLEGEPLDQRLKREAKLPVAEVLRIGREMAEGLAAAHDRGLIHRDIKPGNVWLEGKRARVKILDFGLARSTADEAHLTQSGAIVGTPAYMAPEQAQGREVGPRCDLFSLGCVLYRMSTGQMPFQGTDTISTLVAVAMNDPAVPRSLNPDLPQELSDLVMKLLAKDPAQRSASAQEVVDALRALESDLAAGPAATLPAARRPMAQQRRGSAPAATAALPAAVPPRRRRWLWPVVGACLAAVLGLGAYVVVTVLRVDTGKGTLEPKVATGDKTTAKKDTGPSAGDKTTVKAVAADLGVFDRLRREDIPLAQLTVAGGGNPKKAAKEIVAIFGNPGKDKWLRTFALHPNGKTLAMMIGGHVRLVDLSTRKGPTWSYFLRDCSRMQFSHDGTMLAIEDGGSLAPTALWDVATGKQLQVLEGGAGWVFFSPDDRQIFYRPRREGAPVRRAWVAGRVPLGTPPPPALDKANYPMDTLGLSPDGNVLAASSVTNYESCFVQLWDVRTRKLLGKTNEKERAAFRLVFTPDSKRLAQLHAYVSVVLVFDVATRKQRGVFAHPDYQDVSFNPQGTLAATCDRSGDVRLWDPKTFANLRILQIRPPNTGYNNRAGIEHIEFTPDGRHLLTDNYDGTMYVVRLAPPPPKTAAGPAP